MLPEQYILSNSCKLAIKLRAAFYVYPIKKHPDFHKPECLNV